MHRTLLAAIAILAGCASAHETHDVGSGIYDLTVRGEAGACSPTQETGAMGAVGIVSEADVIDVAVPDDLVGHLARVSLSRSSGFTSSVEVAIEGCPGATLTRTWSIVETAPERFELAFGHEWTGITGCSAARASMPSAPEADCRGEQILDYTLSAACDAPCSLRMTGAAPSCVCD